MSFQRTSLSALCNNDDHIFLSSFCKDPESLRDDWFNISPQATEEKFRFSGYYKIDSRLYYHTHGSHWEVCTHSEFLSDLSDVSFPCLYLGTVISNAGNDFRHRACGSTRATRQWSPPCSKVPSQDLPATLENSLKM